MAGRKLQLEGLKRQSLGNSGNSWRRSNPRHRCLRRTGGSHSRRGDIAGTFLATGEEAHHHGGEGNQDEGAQHHANDLENPYLPLLFRCKSGDGIT